MKCKQYSVKVFEMGIESQQSFIDFIDANYELIKNHLLSIHGEMTEKIKEHLAKNSLAYIHNTPLPLPKKAVQECIIDAIAPEVEETTDSTIEEEIRESPLKIHSSPLRSGQMIQHDGSVLLIDRINSGAKVAAMGSVVALDKVEGDISSVGECLIVPPVTRGNIIFHGQKIENENLIYPLNKITYINDELHIKPISKKELA